LPTPIPAQTTLWNTVNFKGYIAVEVDTASPGLSSSLALTTPPTSNPTTFFSSTLTPTSSSGNIPAPRDTSTPSLSRTAKIGIGAGVGISALLLLIAIVILLVFLRKRKTKSTEKTDMLIAHKPELDGKGLTRAAEVREMYGHSTYEMMDTSNPVEIGGDFKAEMMDTSIPVEMGVRESYMASGLKGSQPSH
jgi:hypothetical protein